MSDNEKTTQPASTDSTEPAYRYNAALAQDIEGKWQKIWDDKGTFWAANVNGDLKDGKGRNADGRPAYFAMDMFPYPSGKGLHVGHPLGYLASDVVSRYHRMKGENVLHAMGYDAFGLPAEQYAVQTGQHPRVTTLANIANMSRQLHRMGLSFDDRRSFATIDPGYVRWTQWIFSRIYDSWYDEDAVNPSGSKGSARPVSELVAKFESGEKAIPGHESDGKAWADLDQAEQQDILNDFRLAYISKSPVNWCPGLGTVLANEEVTAEGKSERGNFPVFQRELRQWSMRITKYGHRLIEDLDGIDWPEKVKLMQRNWIGESHGASVHFTVATADGSKDMEIYTTRPDTLFGTTFAVVSPEHHLLENVPAEWPADVPEDWKGGFATPVEAVKAYRLAAEAKTAKDRVDEGGEKTGLFTGLYATNPITGAKLPLFTADYVLMDYGTGAIMAVPGGDQRDYDFAVKFGLPVIYTVKPLPESGDDLANYEGKAPFVSHDGIVINSSVEATAAKGDALSLNGLRVDDAIAKVNAWLESAGVGKGTVSYRLRDWLFSRQRYRASVHVHLQKAPECVRRSHQRRGGRQTAQRPQGRQGGRCQLDVGSVQQGVGRGPSGSVDPVGPVAAKSLQTYNERLSYSLTQRVIKGRSGDAHEFQILLRATLLCNAFQAAITGHRTAVMFSGQGILASPCNALQASMEPSIVLNRNCGSNPLRNIPAFMPR